MQGIRRLTRSPLGAGIIGGLVVGLLGWLAIAVGWIESEGDGESGLASGPPLTAPAEDQGSNGDRLSVQQIYDRASEAVVFVAAERQGAAPTPLSPLPQGGSVATGSGFVIDDRGHILTNAHVVGNSDSIEVTAGEDSDPVEAELVGSDPSNDLAVLRAEPGDLEASALDLGDSSKVRVGDPVVAIGNPFGLSRTVTTGIVSAKQREIRAPNGFTISNVLQTDAAINPGNSGGPLIDARGQVIGINSQIATGGGQGSVGVGFAVPSSTAEEVAEEIIDTGRAQNAFLGVTGADLSPEIADALNLDIEQGALIQEVTDGGPADEAGLRGGDTEVSVDGRPIVAGGDVIVGVDGEPVEGMGEVIAAINEREPGQTVELEVVRGDQRETVTVELGNRPANASG